MWFFGKSKPSQRPAPPQHRATRRPPTPPTVKLDPIAPQAYDWLLSDAARLDDGADNAEQQATQLLADAAEWRIVAATYRRIAAMHSPDVPLAPVEEPQPDPSRFNPTWQSTPQIIEQAMAEAPSLQQVHARIWDGRDCACIFARGETCKRCDEFVGDRVSILTPWTPASEADAAGWSDGQAGQSPLVNGEVR